MNCNISVRLKHNGGQTSWGTVLDSINTSDWTHITDTIDLNLEGELEESRILASSVIKSTSFYIDEIFQHFIEI